ncbi:HesB/IscA family protein [Hydrogenobaculum acidophilum]
MEAVLDFVLTDRAIKAIKKLALKKQLSNPVFRVSLIKEGCAGYKYHTEFDEATRENDIVIDYGDFKVAIDKDSYEHLKGTELDYIENLMKTNNFIFNNPNIKKTCKCGSSFNFG